MCTLIIYVIISSSVHLASVWALVTLLLKITRTPGLGVFRRTGGQGGGGGGQGGGGGGQGGGGASVWTHMVWVVTGRVDVVRLPELGRGADVDNFWDVFTAALLSVDNFIFSLHR